MLEAKLIGLKEGLKIAVVWLVFYSYLVQKDKRGLIKPFIAGILAALICAAILALVPQVEIERQVLSNIIATSFAFFLILSAALLIHASGTSLFAGNERIETFFNSENNTVLNAAVFLLTIIFFVPDSTGTLLFLKEFSFMRNTGAATYLYASLGLLIPVFILYLYCRFYKPYRIGNYFDLPQILLFLAIVKLLGSGTKGIAELSLIPSVQHGFMKFVHDFVHQTLVLFMVPDHPLLKTTVWDFIGIFFGSGLASFASLIILLFLPFMFIYISLFKPLPEPEARTNVEKRKIKSILLSDRRKKALPVILFTLLILTAWFSQRGETVSRIHDPDPRPVVADKNYINIPLKSPDMDVRDGLIHKFSFVHENEEIRIMVITKPDNSLTVSLDACEICPPEGYGQRGDHVVCLYCDTPIHINALGRPGGCNPVPLSAVVDTKFIRIRIPEILSKWGFIKTGKSKDNNK